MELKLIIEKLIGQELPLNENSDVLNKFDLENLDLGYSQFNELLLFLGLDRINFSFFQYLCDADLESNNPKLSRMIDLKRNADRIIEMSLRFFGNIKYGYKFFSSIANEDNFIEHVEASLPVEEEEYRRRHAPFFPITKIPTDQTYYLGYVVQADLKEKLRLNPDDENIKGEMAKLESIIRTGEANHNAYLASDHMDVYVATSMRLKHEYVFIGQITDEVFSQPCLKELNIRYFDPTQAYCQERIDKGISEALMLKRAQCTLYLAQESDTLGKDSELASTLGQGKTVIAYIPKGDKEYVDKLISELARLDSSLSTKQIIINQLKIFNPEAAWADQKVQEALNGTNHDYTYLLDLLYSSVERKYKSRAATLKDIHPLGIQVNLETGVANGVIVTQDLAECALLIRKVLLRELEFEIEPKVINGNTYTLLKESITKSTYRVSTGDKLLTNTFWNYYTN